MRCVWYLGQFYFQNILIWLQLSLGGYRCTSGFATSIFKWTAWTVGLIYAFCPFVLTLGLASGVTERLNIMWIPLYVCAFECD